MAENSAENYSKEQEYIIDESPEISVGEFPYIGKVFNLFPALKNRNYFLYFSGQLVSLVGTWLQVVAEGWLVLTLTNSALLLGIVAAAASLPTLLFSLYGGLVVDRFPKKRILLFTQSSAMILAFIYGVLTVLKLINIWEIITLAFLLGIVTAVDSPARQAFVPEIVGKERLQSAIALNSGTFNAARVIGPAIAGILIVFVGTGGAFILNAISYLAVIAALFAMKVPEIYHKTSLNPIAAIKEGISYSFKHPIIRSLLFLIGVVSIFGWSYTTILPLIAKNVFGMGAEGLSYLYIATGLGALLATAVVSATAGKFSPVYYIFGGNFIFAAFIILFSLHISFIVSLIALFCAGFGLITQLTTLNSTIQHMVPNVLRGRVMSIYVLMFIGTAPLGNFEIGWLTDRIGPSLSIQIGAFIVLSFGLLMFLRRNKIVEEYRQYRDSDNSSL